MSVCDLYCILLFLYGSVLLVGYCLIFSNIGIIVLLYYFIILILLYLSF